LGKNYKNPPIVEALCEFQFVPGQPWDATIPGMFYERIKNKFPIKQQQVGFGAGIVIKECEAFGIPSPRMQFFSEDRHSLVQSGLDLLTINYLKPYPTWGKFKSLILEILRKYKEVASPKGFKKIGLRYINKIDLEQNIKIKEYFNFYPLTPDRLPQAYKSFQTVIDIPYENERDLLHLALMTIIPERPDTISLALDIYYIMVVPEKVGLDNELNWLENAHTTIEEAFEICITDKCRSLFEEVK
jgi:uncharacterized protein (TIGR04255 family)